MTLRPQVAPILSIIRSYWICLSVFLTPFLNADKTYDHRGIPYYRFYSEKEFNSAARGLQIAVAPNNTVFFSQDHMLSSYNGSTWDKVYEPSETNSKVTAIKWINNTTYVGSVDSIGRLVVNEANQTEYVPYGENGKTDISGQSFTEIHELGERIVFGSLRGIAILDPQTNEIEFHDLATWTRKTFIHQGVLYAATDVKGVYRYENGAFVLDPRFAQFAGRNRIKGAVLSPEGDLIFGTHSAELFRFDGDQIKPAYSQFFDQRNNPINDILFTDTGELIICMAGKGIYVLDKQGRIKHELTNTIDYRFGNPLKTVVDHNGTVWALFNSYVAKFILNSPITAVDERLRPALEYPTPHVIDGKLHIRNQGELSEAIYNEADRLIGFRNKFPELSHSVITSAVSPRGLYLRMSNELYEWDGEKTTLIIEGIQFERMLAIPGEQDLLLGVTPDRFELFRRGEDRFELISQTKNTGGFVHKLAQDGEQNIWLEMGTAKVGRAWIQDEQLNLKVYKPSDGLDNNWISLWMHSDKMYFTSGDGIQEFEPTKDEFIRSPILDPIIPHAEQSFVRVASDPKGNIFVATIKGNTAFWKKADGSYERDANTLASMGNLHLDILAPLPDDKLLFITPQQMFHVDPALRKRPTDLSNEISFSRISGISGEQNKYINIGYRSPPETEVFESGFKNIAFHLTDASSDSLQQSQYQYNLEGLTQGWSNWSKSSKFYFTNLEHGRYKLNVRAKFGDGRISEPLIYAFSIKPPLSQTWLAYHAYAIVTGLLIYGAFALYSRRLKYQNIKLEGLVSERTQEIEIKNQELEKQADEMEVKNAELAAQSEETRRNASQLEKALSELRHTQDQLMSTARKAGMAEVATNVLHNVGNVLNSVNIGIVNLSTKISKTRLTKLSKVASLLEKKRDCLPEFFANDPKGKAIPDYLQQLSKVATEEFQSLLNETNGMKSNIDHIKRIISTQQAHAKSVEVVQSFQLNELIDSALKLVLGDAPSSAYRVTCSLQPNLTIESDRHKILEMLTNFLKNAKEAIKEGRAEVGEILIKGAYDSQNENAILTIGDNGIGIATENLSKIFSHGFTTKLDGHGFGMHSCANSVKALGGDVSIDSEGIGKGATITLTLPKAAPLHLERNRKKNSILV